MKKMKAFIRVDPASQEVVLQEVAVPTIKPDEVLIKVEAFGVGIHDRYFIPMEVAFPYVIGSEGAGVIVETGQDVKEFAVGAKVIFTTILQPQGGSWAEYAVAKQTSLINLPDNLSFAQGAALPIASKTALECLRELSLSQGDSLFVAGASGAIGTLIIQMAAAAGVKIAASASAHNHAYMKDLGAEKTVDYHDADWIQSVKDWSKTGVTAALAIQPGTGQDSLQVVKDGGTLITVSGDNAGIAPQRGIAVRQMGHQADTQHKVEALVEAVSEHQIKVVIEKEYPFAEALQALQKTETRSARGKVIVNVTQ